MTHCTYCSQKGHSAASCNRRRLIRRLALIGWSPLAFGGCAGGPIEPAVQVTASDYCEIAEKIAWSINDTPATIQQVRRENAKFDGRCAVPPVTARSPR